MNSQKSSSNLKIMREVYENGQKGFCPRCFEPSIYISTKRADSSVVGFWWHESTGNPRYCSATNWLEGIMFDPEEAERGRLKLLGQTREERESLLNKRSVRRDTTSSQPTATQIMGHYISGGIPVSPPIPGSKP